MDPWVDCLLLHSVPVSGQLPPPWPQAGLILYTWTQILTLRLEELKEGSGKVA